MTADRGPMGFGIRGYTYLGMLFIVAILGSSLAVVGQSWSTSMTREREQELLFIGNEFRRAITTYYNVQDGTATKKFPDSLEDLLEDRRSAVTRRHLRRIYIDPMTGKADWGLILSPDKRIMGVYSRSQGVPIKRAHFKTADAPFGEASHYSDWKFSYRLPTALAAGEGDPNGAPLVTGAPPAAVSTVDTTVTVAVAREPAMVYKPTPPASSDDPQLQKACERIRRTDMQTCRAIKTSRGEEKSQECAGYAQNRHDICLSGTGQSLPPLPNYFAEE